MFIFEFCRTKKLDFYPNTIITVCQLDYIGLFFKYVGFSFEHFKFLFKDVGQRQANSEFYFATDLWSANLLWQMTIKQWQDIWAQQMSFECKLFKNIQFNNPHLFLQNSIIMYILLKNSKEIKLFTNNSILETLNLKVAFRLITKMKNTKYSNMSSIIIITKDNINKYNFNHCSFFNSFKFINFNHL